MKFYLVLLLSFMCLLIGCTNLKPQEGLNYPKIEAISVKDTIFNKVVIDEYRNLEEVNNKNVENWYLNQTHFSDSILNSISNRDKIMTKLLEYDSRVSASISNIKIMESGAYYYLKREANEDKYKLWYRKNFDSEEKLLFSPEDYIESNENYTINYFAPSWDESKIAISLSYSGKEISDILIYDTNSKNISKEVLKNAWPSSFLGINWLPDSSGFIYLYFPETDARAKNFKKGTYSVLYRLGDSADELRPLLGSKQYPEMNISETSEFPIVTIKSQYDNFVLGYLATVENHWDAYIAPIEDLKKGKINWRPFFKKEDKVFTSKGQFYDDSFIYKGLDNSSTYQIAQVKTVQSNFENPIWLTSSINDENIDDFEVLKDHIAYTTTENGVDAHFYILDSENKSTEVEIPQQAGSIEIASINSKNNFLWVETSGWTSDYTRYIYNIKNQEFTKNNLSKRIGFPEFENIVAEEVLVPGHDGVEIPCSIIFNKNIQLNGNNPALLFGYGAYGSSINPFFSPTFLYWVEQGGVFCVPHVRGGGEKGDEWYEGGKMLKKENTWKDLISCTEYLIAKGYTSKDRTAIYSMSAGAIMVGRAAIERPDLFKAMVAEVGILNPLRNEAKTDNGGSNVSEFGSLKDSLQSSGLIQMDPYLNLNIGVKYPAMLITGGSNDPRVPIWMPGKFAAKAQKSSIGNNPILLKINYESGHGDFDETKSFYQDYVDLFSFCFWQTGNPDFSIGKDNANKVQ